jgi:hypothetical protein
MPSNHGMHNILICLLNRFINRRNLTHSFVIVLSVLLLYYKAGC